jgi:hypothetical protein
MKTSTLAEKNIIMRPTNDLFREVYEELAEEKREESVLCDGIMNI